MPTGRPTDYDPAFVERAAELCAHGATDQELADEFGVHVSTIYAWRARHQEFREAVIAGKDAADDRVERSLFHRAVGYTFDAIKIMQEKGDPLIVPYREHVPPDVGAAMNWLKNRRPDKWREKQEIDVSVRSVVVAPETAPSVDAWLTQHASKTER